MNLNAEQGELKNLHRAYNSCLSANLQTWMTETAAPTQQEWCATEKAAYLTQMRQHMPVQYENIMRLEQNNF